jgi:hypothetical protein
MTTEAAPAAGAEATPAAAAEAAPEYRREPPCWPGPPDWFDGATEIELPSERYLKARWDADILDIDDANWRDTIIERKDTFKVCFRVELRGRLWKCICGDWCFDVGFTAIGDGPDFNLSDKLPNPSVLRLPNWKGCETRCVRICVTVPPDTIPVEACGTLYQVGAKFELRCCGEPGDECGGQLAVAGHEPQGEYMFV